MAELLEQHRLDLNCRGVLQPVGIEIDGFTALGCGAGVSAVDAAQGGAVEDFEADPQSAAAQAGLQGGSGGI